MTPKVGPTFLPSHVPQCSLFLGGGEVACHEGRPGGGEPSGVISGAQVPLHGQLQHGTKRMCLG